MAKFTIQQVLESIKPKFTNAEGKTSLQLSDRTITETLEPLLGLVGEEMEVGEFVDKYGLKAIDSANRNLIKMNSDFVKNYKPETQPPAKPEDKPGEQPLTMDQIKEAMAESMKTVVADAIKPMQEKLEGYESKKNLESRRDAVKNLKESNYKLTPAWDVDFNNSIEYAEMALGKDADAQAVYDKAVEKFNQTLSARNETYKPAEGSGGGDKPNFEAIIKKREAEKKAREGK